MKISYIDSGLGNNFGDEIELNKNLLKPEYKQIHDAVLKHELEHTNNLFTLHDLKLDLSSSKINSFDVIKFMWKHPRSFSQLLPIYYTKKHGFVYDINLIIIYSFGLIFFSLISFIALHV